MHETVDERIVNSNRCSTAAMYSSTTCSNLEAKARHARGQYT